MLVRLLGPVDLVGEDGTVRQSGSQLRRALLALLAVRCGQVISSDWLLEHLWRDGGPDSGLRAVRFHVSQLRKELGDLAPIETRPGGYRLDVPRDAVDAAVFEDRARAAHVESDDHRAAVLCMDALALWRGEPFLGAAGCPTLDDEAVRLENLRLTVIEEAFRRRLASGSAAELIADLSQLVKEQPLRESLWSSLMVAQYRAGQQADALRSYEQLRTTLAETLGVDPSPELQSLQLRILQQDPGLVSLPAVEDRTADARARSAPNLPAVSTSFVEAPGTIDAVRELVRARRLVTLTGAGGVGKTRLAIEVGLRSRDDFRDGLHIAELGPVVGQDAVEASIAASLAVTPHGGVTTIESVVDWCRRRQALIIVDNCEHVIEAASEAVATIVSHCPTVTILATSREPLGLDGEHVYRVAPLGRDEAVALFNERAVAADTGFTPDDGAGAAVAALCERLDGIPLAIELAAVRVRSMSPSELLARLEDRFRLLRAPPRARPERHHTLEAAVAWSFDLLDDTERIVFERATVFAGSFDLAAAEAICADDVIDRVDVVDLVGSLVDKSLVTASRQPTGTRYRILETLRAFGQRQLTERGHEHTLRGRHLLHYAGIAKWADRLFRSRRQIEGQQMFDDEWDNVRAAHQWAIVTADLEQAEVILGAARIYAESRVRVEVGDWAERTLLLASAERAPRPETFGMAASWANWAGDRERALSRVRRGIASAPSPDHPSTTLCWCQFPLPDDPLARDLFAVCGTPFDHLEAASFAVDLEHHWWVLVALVQRAIETARPDPSGRAASSLRRHLDRLRELAERVGAPSLRANTALCGGHELIDRDPPDEGAALEAYQCALVITRSVGDVSLRGDALRTVALATTLRRVDNDAINACHTALDQLYDDRNWYRLWQIMESVALVLASNGQEEEASTLLGHLEAWHPPFSREASFGFRRRALELVHHHARVDAWKARGAAMDRDEIVLHAIRALRAAGAPEGLHRG